LNDSMALSKMISTKRSQFDQYPKTTDLRKKSGPQSAVLKNETNQNCMVIVFKDEKKEKVFSSYLHVGDELQFKLSKEEVLFILPGGNVSTNLQYKDLPFKQFSREFYLNLNVMYRVLSTSKTDIKLIWEDLGAQEFYLVDLNGGLERM
jgi:hypothetical protein